MSEAADDKVAVLQVTIDRHSKFTMMVCSDLELDNTKKKIDENSNCMDTYIKQVTDLCETEIEAIRQITEQLSQSISTAASTNSSRRPSSFDNVTVPPDHYYMSIKYSLIALARKHSETYSRWHSFTESRTFLYLISQIAYRRTF